ncbi:DNA ligase 1-like [Bolinopsis microptera]|uniref:DNA ligase 1-like n=1 Tax=Bolinopsis microptera TaxID=2820187 RepID=UPI00307AC9E4
METSPPPSSAIRPSPVSSKLSSFSYKKRAVSSENCADKSDNSTKDNSLKVNLKETLCPESSEEASVTKSKGKSPVLKKETKSPTASKTKTPESKPRLSKTKTPESKPVKKEIETPGVGSKGVSLVSANSTGGYNPGKSGYVPSKDAIWKSGQDVPYKALSDTLRFVIEGTTKRLEKTMLLSNFLRSVCILTPDDLHLCVYLCTNQVAPAYKGVELGVGETVVMRAVAEACGVNIKTQKSKMSELGDLGLVAESSRSNQKMMFKPKPLTVKLVFETFLKITAISGNQGQSQKIALIKKMLVSAQGSEARYITRSLLGKLRCGLADQTVLVSLGHATVLTPPGGSEDCAVSSKNMVSAKEDAAEVVKTSFCEFPNFEHIIEMIREHGVLESAAYCKLTPGVPVKPMLAHPTKGISEVLTRFEGSKFTCEYKYDGERAQIQCSETGEISIFSRNQENNTSKYPDIISRIGSCLTEGTNSFMLDCEVVAWDVEREQILPFQILTTRKRKDADVNEIKVIVCLFAFDLLYLNGESLIREPFRKRRELLHSAFKEVPGQFIFATAKDCNDTEEIQIFLEESIKGQCEGLMVKTLDVDATYEIAKRSHNWLKVKKDYLEGCGDSLDLVVIGAFNGKGKRSGSYGGYLLACYDPDSEQYQAICKIGTGFTDEDLAGHHAALAQHIVTQAKPYYSFPESSAPDVWFEPALVWEVKCADMTISPIYTAAVGQVDPDKGISLRFPRFIRIRDDKTAEEATSAEQVAELYNKQDNKQEHKKQVDEEDDY